MKRLTCIEDLRVLARRKVPRAFYDYVDTGSYNEETYRANRTDLEAIGDGEILSAQAAKDADIPFTLSTMSICSIEDVAQATGSPFWFQLYVIKDRSFSKDILERAWNAKCNALVLTVDLQVLGQRHRDIKNGMTVPPEIRIKNIIDIASKPRWAWSILNGKRKTFGNLAGHVKGMDNVNQLAAWTAQQFDPALSWRDVEWIKSIWPGKLIIKGILDAEDARTAAKLGADAIVVSNHGGRQLDGAPSSISALPVIADAVGSDTEVLFDGGIRTGADILRALGLGARACLIGRAYIYGLGAAGRPGVDRAIEILKSELSIAMALTGMNSIAEIGRHVIVGGADADETKKPAARKRKRPAQS
jgi:L-lactate dehydrogenase (cytochrome)